MPPLTGKSTLGDAYSSVEEMWQKEVGDGKKEADKKPEWYTKGVDYWRDVPATVDGVLGGFGNTSRVDIRDSEVFLRQIADKELLKASGLVVADCGAGIGRIAENLLLRFSKEVDVVEPLKHFLDTAEKNLKARVQALPDPGSKKLRFVHEPLEDFTPEAGRYDVIWIQWCIGHLTDDDLVALFRRCQTGLRPGGTIVLKENVCEEGFVVDKEDSSVTRSNAYFRTLIARSGLEIINAQFQRNFPKELFKVIMYAMRPAAVTA